MAILKFASAMLCVALVACMREPALVELSDRNVVVHALLIGGEDSAKVLVTRPRTTTEDEGPMGIGDADVRLITPGQTIALGRGDNCFSFAVFPPGAPATNAGCYVGAVPGGIMPGVMYELEIVVPGRPTIRGSTRIPETPLIHSPVAHADVGFSNQNSSRPTVQMTWSVGESNAPVTLHVRVGASNCTLAFRASEFGLMPYIQERGSGSVLAELRVWNCAEPPTRAPGEIVVTAFDHNYGLHVGSFNTSVSPEEASIGLMGAFGVVASAARATVPVTLVQQ